MGRNRALALTGVGALLIVLAALQHAVLQTQVLHLAVYLGVVGALAALAGVAGLALGERGMVGMAPGATNPGLALMGVGALLIVLAALQHVVLQIQVLHLAIYLGVLGVLAGAAGAALLFQASQRKS